MNNLTYYLSANSCSGYTSFFNEIAKSIRKIIVLKNITKNEKKKLFDKITEILNSKDISYDTCLSCASRDDIDAVIINDYSTVIVNEELITDEIPLCADVVDFSATLTFGSDAQKTAETRKKQMSTIKARMFLHLDDAKRIHDRWEKIYISNMDFLSMDIKGDEIIKNIFSKVPDKNGETCEKHRFFGTLLPRNNINYIEELTKGFEKRLFIKGRPGTGKSTFLKKICHEALKYGYSPEIYHCSFDVKSLDMVIIRDLSFAAFDSTSPHEIFPSCESDSVFDIYETAVNADTDEVYADELMHISNEYNQSIKKAKECLYTYQMFKRKYEELFFDKEISEKAANKVMSLASLSNY